METIALTDPPITVRLRPDSRARRFTLRLDPSGCGAVLTIPPRVQRGEIRAFLDRHAAWLRDAHARQ